MPSFYTGSLPGQLPLTPPEYCDMHSDAVYNQIQRSSAVPYGQPVMSSRFELGTNGLDPFKIAKQFPQLPNVPQLNGIFHQDLDRQPGPFHIAPLVDSRMSYAATGGSLLPPIRVAQQKLDEHQHQRFSRSQPVPPPKEEKATGGVAAHLDYEMDQMTNFVSEVAQGMYDLYESRICLADIDIIQSVHHNAPVPKAFHKYVSQVLTSTRLPKATILLGLHYLATRMTMLSENNRYTASSGQAYRMLTTALLLGSKFLDDNTFQNRSWSEVSNIPVSELNALELEWLLAIDWKMHVDSDMDAPNGAMIWHKHWNKWQTKEIEISLDSLKLTPLDTNIGRQRHQSKQFLSAPLHLPSYNDFASGLGTKFHTQPRSHNARYDLWAPTCNPSENSPPSAPETGPNTPDRYGNFGSNGYNNGASAYPLRTMPPPMQMQPSGFKIPIHAQYHQHYTPSIWNNHGTSCACGYCVSQYDRYLMASGFGAQPVAG